jgi:4-methyl-5(b-hydroxyethyl)-thiazole monophosphate biosynthesis
MTYHIVLADGFEDIEAIAVIDILKRAKQHVVTVGLDKHTITSSAGLSLNTDTTLDQIDGTEIYCLILPGGKGVEKLDESETLNLLIEYLIQNEVWISAVCAAPIILGKRGFLDGRKFTCYPSFESQIPNGIYTASPIEVSKPFITGRGIGYIEQFAFKILEMTGQKNTIRHVEETTLIKERKSKK